MEGKKRLGTITLLRFRTKVAKIRSSIFEKKSPAQADGEKKSVERPEKILARIDRRQTKVLRERRETESSIKKLESGISANMRRLDDILKTNKRISKHLVELHRAVDQIREEQYTNIYPDLVNQSVFDASKGRVTDVVVALMSIIGSDSKVFVDIGCGRSGGNSSHLARIFGWKGIYIDASERAISVARTRFGKNPNISYVVSMVTPENINDIVGWSGFDVVDMISIDIDSYDYFLFEAIKYKPRMFVVEFNAWFGSESITVPLGGIDETSPKIYRGASLMALSKLASEKGYKLIGCDRGATNAFFVRDDLASKVGVPKFESVLPAPVDRLSGEAVSFSDVENAVQKIKAQNLPLQTV